MKLIIFSGFLGSGKTMLILSLAEKLLGAKMSGAFQDADIGVSISAGLNANIDNENIAVSGNSDGRMRLVIIENEVGETGVDDKLLNSAGYTVKSILAGCICCSLSADLISALNDISKKYNPEYVVFEPTGVAFPDKIIEAVGKYGENIESINVITVIDAKRYDKLMIVTPGLITGQVESAGLILINKCDLVTDEAIDNIEANLRAVNKTADIRRISAVKGVPDAIWLEVLSL